ncbi:unnamed protein product, partial [Closterium sp. NIES-54]
MRHMHHVSLPHDVTAAPFLSFQINFQSLKRHPCLFLSRSHGSKGLAPHLKQLMGPWWVAQFDSSRDVAAAATVSFQAAFPTPTRRVEALAFTWEAVVGTLAELLAATPQSLAAADRSLSVEEAKHRLDE